MRKALNMFGVLIFVSSLAIGTVGYNHPIFLKRLIGEAGTLGRPIEAKVYTNGYSNNGITVYKDPKYKNDYLLSLNKFDTGGMLHYINIDLDNKWVGRPVGAGKSCYDIVNDELYQDEVGANFVDFKDDIKGYNFDPNLRSTRTEIEFNVPPHQLTFDSIRIELPHD